MGSSHSSLGLRRFSKLTTGTKKLVSYLEAKQKKDEANLVTSCPRIRNHLTSSSFSKNFKHHKHRRNNTSVYKPETFPQNTTISLTNTMIKRGKVYVNANASLKESYFYTNQTKPNKKTSYSYTVFPQESVDLT